MPSGWEPEVFAYDTKHDGCQKIEKILSSDNIYYYQLEP